jgi:O-antigen/teichoic acid export membrane protein
MPVTPEETAEAPMTGRWRPGGGARLPRVASRIGFNGIAQLIPLLVAFAVTPLLLHHLGLDRYGIWSLALAVLSTLAALDGGVSASLARFFALYGAREDRRAAGQLVTGALLVFALFGLVLTPPAIVLAPTIVHLLNIPHRLSGEAILVLRCLPALAALGLMSDATAALLEGNNRYRALAISTLASSITFAIAVVVLVGRGAHLRELLIATAVRYLVLGLASSMFALRHLTVGFPLLPSRTAISEVWRFSSRMQLSALTGLVNTELDALVIAAVLPVRYVGLYGIGLQAASAARSLPLYAFSPLLTVLARTFGRDGREVTAAAFRSLEARWLPAVLGYGAIAVAGVGFSVVVWLGPRYRLAGLAAAILLSGYIVHVALTGMRTCFVRAVGRPGLETRCSSVWTLGNAILTVPMALAGGLLGVVGATAITGIVASVYFVGLCRRQEHLAVVVPGRTWWYRLAVATGLTVIGELVVLQIGASGFFPLLLTGIPGLAGLLIIGFGGRRPRLAPA